MSSESSLRTLFNEALEREDPVERARYLDEACGTDSALRQRVEKLLRAHEQAGGFLSEPSKPPPPERTVRIDLPVTEKAGDRIGRYKLLQQIGEGGCGIVYMADQEEPVRRRVALKIIKLGMVTKQVVARFEAERQALAMMDHPNIAKVLGAGATDTGRPYFVMDLVRGIKITDFCDQKHLTTEQRLNLFVQVCKAVQHAHQKGIIHRDLKPSNILVTLRDGVPVPKVIDFGIARATGRQRLTDKTLFTAFEQFIGTPAYMSPEQAEMGGLDIDTRTDIYSLGVLLYELLTGKTPFDAKELLAVGLDEMRRTIREKQPVRPSTRLGTMQADELTTTAEGRQTDPPRLIHMLRGDLDWIAMKCLEKDRTRRYETAYGLALEIERHLNHEPVLARPPTNLYRLQKLVQRNKPAFAAGSAVAAALMIGLGLSTWLFLRERAALKIAGEHASRAEEQSRQAERARRQAEANERRAEVEAVRSEQVAHFLREMLEGVGPAVALGRDTTTLQQILDRTAERIGEGLNRQPAMAAELRNTIAQVYLALGEFEKSEAMQRATLALRKALHGDEHLDVAASLHDLGWVLHELGRPAEAETFCREALALRRKLLGNEHRDLAASLNDLGVVLYHRGKFNEAEQLLREGLEMRRTLQGTDHREVAQSLSKLEVPPGHAPVAWDRAESLHREALAIRRKFFGDEHPGVADYLNTLGAALRAQGKLAEAESAHQEALAMRKELLPPAHPRLAWSLEFLGCALHEQGKLAEAEAAFREALTIRRGWNSDELSAGLIAELLLTLLSLDRFADAEPLAREWLRIRQETPDDWRSFHAQSLLGGSLLGQRRHAEAEPLLLSGYEGLKQRKQKIPAPRRARVMELWRRIVGLYEADVRPERVAEWNKKLAEFDEPQTAKLTDP